MHSVIGLQGRPQLAGAAVATAMRVVKMERGSAKCMVVMREWMLG